MKWRAASPITDRDEGQVVVSLCDRVTLVVAGQPLELK